MPEMTWNKICVLILASAQLVRLLHWREPTVLLGKVNTLTIGATILCSAMFFYLLSLLPQLFPLLLILAIAGAAEMLLLTADFIKHQTVETSVQKIPTPYANPNDTIRPLPAAEKAEYTSCPDTLAANCTTYPPKVESDGKLISQSRLQNIEEELRQYQEREKKYVQDIANLTQEIQRLATKSLPKETSTGYSIPQASHNFLTSPAFVRNVDQTLPVHPETSAKDELEYCWGKIADHKQSIESLLQKLNHLQTSENLPPLSALDTTLSDNLPQTIARKQETAEAALLENHTPSRKLSSRISR